MLHRIALDFGGLVATFGRCNDGIPGFEIDAGIRHLAGGEHDEVGVGDGIFFVEDQVLERDLATIATGDL